MGLQVSSVLFQCGDQLLFPENGLRKIFQQLIFQCIPLAFVVGLDQFQLCHLCIEFRVLNNARVARRQCLHLGVGQGRSVDILAGAGGVLAARQLANEFLLVLQYAPVISVEGALGDILENFHLFEIIAAPQDTTLPLLNVGWPPGTIDVVECRQTLLAVGARPHFCSRAEENAYLTLSDICEQFCFLIFGFGLVYERDLLFRYAHSDQLCPDILIDILERGHFVCTVLLLRHLDRTCISGCRQVAENHLCTFLLRRVLPHLIHVLNAHIDLAFRVIRQVRIGQPLIQRQLSAIRRDLEHIVLARFHHSAADQFGPFAQVSHHVLLIGAGLCHHRDALMLRHRQLQHIRCLNVCGLPPHCHQFRQIKESGKSCAGTKAGALRGKLHGRHRFTEGSRPAVKMRQPGFLQRLVLQIPHHRIQFRHGV